MRDSTFVLDGLLYHDSELEIAERSTDMAGFTDHVVALMHLLGFRFGPRLRNFGDAQLYVPKDASRYPALWSVGHQPLGLVPSGLEALDPHTKESPVIARDVVGLAKAAHATAGLTPDEDPPLKRVVVSRRLARLVDCRCSERDRGTDRTSRGDTDHSLARQARCVRSGSLG